MGSLSNRASLVNNLLSLELYAGIRVVFAVGMTPPHDGLSRVRPPFSYAASLVNNYRQSRDQKHRIDQETSLHSLLRSSFDSIRPDKKIGRNFPCLANLVDHVDRSRR